METIFIQRLSEFKKAIPEIERFFKVKITFNGRKADIEGDSVGEYEASIVTEAINFGFSAKKALLLKEENMEFREIPIKGVTRRKNLHEVRARLIGTEGKTKRTIEQISNCHVEINNNTVGVICPAETMDEALTGVKNVIKGTKQANVYRYLERMNKIRKERKFQSQIRK